MAVRGLDYPTGRAELKAIQSSCCRSALRDCPVLFPRGSLVFEAVSSRLARPSCDEALVRLDLEQETLKPWTTSILCEEFVR